MKKLWTLMLLCLLIAFVPSISALAAYTEDEEEALKSHAEILLATKFKDGNKILELYKVPTAYFINQNVINGIEKDGELYFEQGTKLSRGQAARLFAQALDLKETMNVTFTDVLDHWALHDIEKVVKAGIMSGKSSAIFAPDDILTNAEIASMIARTFELTEKANMPQTEDLPKSHWAYESYSKVIAANIFKITTTKANPDYKISRGDFVYFLYKALEFKNELKEQQYPAQYIIDKAFILEGMAYTNTYNVNAYELILNNDLKIEPALLQVTYGDKLLTTILDDKLYSDVQIAVMDLLIPFKQYGLETSITATNEQTTFYIYSNDPSKQLSIKANAVNPEGDNLLINALPKKIDFTKDVAPFSVYGSGAQHFSISYNGKIDHVTLDAVFYSKDELFKAINKQLINTGVKIESVGTGTEAKTRFIAPTAIHNMEIEFEDEAGDYSAFAGYSLPSFNK